MIKKSRIIQALLIIAILLLQIILPTVNAIAVEANLVTIQFQEVNMYNAMVEELGSKVSVKDDANMTIKMTQKNIDSVKSLTISDKKIKNITGIEYFTSLTELHLNSNQISDITPLSELIKLTNLELRGEFVSTKGNRISDISPLSGLTNLTNLNLGYNQIRDITPLSRLTKLTNLNLGHNKINDITPLEKLINLNSLDLYGNEIDDLNSLSALENIKIMDLGNNNIEELSGIENLISLEKLYLYKNNFSSIEEIKDLTNLTVLELSYNDITNIEALKNLINLKRLNIGGGHYIGLNIQGGGGTSGNGNPKEGITDLKPISNLTNLEILYIDYNHISDLEPLSKLTNLKCLYAENNDIEEIDSLANLKNLETLTIYHNEIENIEALSDLTKLSELKLGGSDYYANNKISNIEALAGLMNLKSLNLNYNQINDISVLSKLTNLNSLGVYGQNLDIIVNEGTIVVELPPIFIQAKDEDNKAYTEEEFTLKNCTLSEDGTKVTLNEGVQEASIQINGGKLDKSILTIKVQPITLTSEEYIVEEERVRKLQPETTVKEFKENIETNATLIEIYNTKGEKLKETDLIGTGMTLKLNGIKTYTLVVLGDVNGDSKANFRDILTINKDRLGEVLLQEPYKTAADVNGDGRADFMDILKINKYRLGIINSL